VGSSHRVVALPDGLGALAIYPPDHQSADRSLFGLAAPHCRLSDGCTVVWHPTSVERRFAGLLQTATCFMDAELIKPGLPVGVASQLGDRESSSVLRWTRLEVAAKVTGVPVHLLLTGRAPMPDIPMASVVVGGLAVTVATSDSQCCVNGSRQEDARAHHRSDR
jgi:hypothetical protein